MKKCWRINLIISHKTVNKISISNYLYAELIPLLVVPKPINRYVDHAT